MIDCPDPRALARFYFQVLGMTISEDTGDWVVIGTEAARRQLAFQRAAPWFHRAGPTRCIPSRCTWTSASATPMRPSVTCWL